MEGLPEAHGAITNGEYRPTLQTSALEIQEHLLPAQRTLTETISYGEQLLVPILISCHDHQDAGHVVIKTDIEVYPIGPEVHICLLGKVSSVPFQVFFFPFGLQPDNVRGG